MALVAGLAAVAVVAGVALTRHTKATPVAAPPVNEPPAPPVKPANVTLMISSTPVGAEILRGKDSLGTTTVSIELPHNDKPIVLLLKKHDFRDREVWVTTDRDARLE